MLTEEQLNTLREFKKFAPKFLVIRTKSGQPRPFEFNRAQTYLHDRLQAQKEKTGRVRAVILKGRQQGCCHRPNMRVLTSDYRWITLDEVKVGDRLISVDEELSPELHPGGKRYPRKMRIAIVEHKAELKKQTYEIKFDNGTTIVSTGEHRYLGKKRGWSIWREVSSLKIGDEIRYFTSQPKESTTPHDDGWFGGLLDGEGTYRENPQIRIAFSQVDGVVLQKAKKYLEDRNISYWEGIDNRKAGSSSKFGNKPVHCIAINRFSDMIEILSKCRPARFVDKPIYEGHELPGKAIKGGNHCWTKVVSIKPLKKERVIDLQTSTKTYICEGLVSHNSTYIQARFFHQVITSRGKKAFILTHDKEATKNLFSMAQRFYENLEPGLVPKPDTANAKELYFKDFDSGYAVGTAGNRAVGRSQTVQLFHGSETAFWAFAEDHSKGILQAISNEAGTEVILESTANGIGNYFHQRWLASMAGNSDYQAIFLPWYWQDEYTFTTEGFNLTSEEEDLYKLYSQNGLTNAHLSWRRVKIAEFSKDFEAGRELFQIEYPFNATEAFKNPIHNVFIPSKYVDKARKQDLDVKGPLIIGVDVAISDRDRTAIIRRRGRVAYNLERMGNYNTMEICGKLKRVILEENPSKVYIDCIGVGAGVVDRMQEMGFSMVEGVNVARSANDKEKFKNLRAELWSDMRDWFQGELPVQIPDQDELHGEICSLGFKENSSGQIQIESKDDLRARGMPSPDGADALSLTFFGGFYGDVGHTLIEQPQLSQYERSLFR